jgi:hypothetical protein
MPKSSNFSSGFSSSSSSKSSAPRNSPIPRAEPRQISHEQIAKRAYEIYVSGKGGSQLENWTRAERELKGQ